MEQKEVLSPYIFREYDIRGVYPDTVNEEVAKKIGESFGSYIQDLGKNQCVIGHDNRYSSESLTKALVEGITSTGCCVVFLGLVTTPMYYYACLKLDIPSGIMVTASHNPKDDNGFKMAFDHFDNAKGEEIQAFYRYTVDGNFRKGQGKVSTYSIKNDYLKLMRESLSFGNRRIKVVIDCGNGTTSILAKELYEMFPIDLMVLYGDSDPSFPNHHPDPCVESNLEVLKKTVVERQADVGIGFDGDGDRVGFVDEKGNYVPTDLYMILMIRDMFPQVENKTFLYDVKCSRAVEDEIKKLGGTPYCYRTGNSYTKKKVKDEDMPFGGELSGHVYFRDRFLGFDSGLYAGLRLVELLSKSDRALSSYLEDIPKYVATEELKFKSTDELKFSAVEDVKRYASEKGYEVLLIDGVKILFDDSWALIRVSNTGPNVTARFEAKTEERLQALQDEFLPFIRKYER